MKVKIDDFVRVFLIHACFHSSERMIFATLSQNAVRVTTVGTVSCLRSPDIAIHQNSHCTTSQNAAPAKKLQNAQAQSAAPATRRRHAKIDTLLKYCACHATRKRHPKEQNHAICEEIQLQQMILSHFVSAAQRHCNNAILRTKADGSEHTRTAANARATVGKHGPTPRPHL